MGRRRIGHHELPRRVYVDVHGHYRLFPKGGKPITLARGWDFAAAMAAYGRLVVDPTRPLRSMSEVFDRYQLEVLPLKAPRTQQDNARELLHLRKSFASRSPLDLAAPDVYRHMDARGAPTRANREKALLSHICSYAIRWGAMPANPCRDVKRFPEYPRQRSVTDAEFAFFRVIAPAVLQIYVDLKYATAMRKGDILGLRLAQITSAGIEYQEGKKRRRRAVTRAGQMVVEDVPPRRRVVRWAPGLRAIVERAKALPRRAGEEHLFTGRDGRRLTAARFDAIWQRAMRKAVARGLARFTEHDLRAASAAADPATAQRRLGHASASQTAAYLRNREVDAYDPVPVPGSGAGPDGSNVIPFRRPG